MLARTLLLGLLALVSPTTPASAASSVPAPAPLQGERTPAADAEAHPEPGVPGARGVSSAPSTNLQRILVRVLDEAGRPVAFEGGAGRRMRGGTRLESLLFEELCAGWKESRGPAPGPALPRVLVRTLDLEGRATGFLHSRAWHPTADPAVWELWVTPRSDLVLALTTADRPLVTRRLAVARVPHVQRVDLRLPERTGVGGLELTLDLGERPARPARIGLDGILARVVDRESGVWLDQHVVTVDRDRPRLDLDLPPGRYRLELEPASLPVECVLPGELESREVLPRPATHDFEVVAGRRLRAEVALEPRCALAVRLPDLMDRARVPLQELRVHGVAPDGEAHTWTVEPFRHRTSTATELRLYCAEEFQELTSDLSPGTWALTPEVGDHRGPTVHVELRPAVVNPVELRVGSDG